MCLTHAFSITRFLLVIPAGTIVSRPHITAFLIQRNIQRFGSKMEYFTLLIALSPLPFYFLFQSSKKETAQTPGAQSMGTRR